MLKHQVFLILTLASSHLAAAFAPSSNTITIRFATQVKLYQSDADELLTNKSSTSKCNAVQSTRRHAITTALLSLVTGASSAQAAVIGAGRCANGEGAGCDSLAEGNEYIQSLQRRSSENKEENQQEALYSYYMRNYPDVFAVSDKRMVMKPDRSFALYSPAEVQELVNAGKINIEYPKTMGGRVVDLTQKPVLVLKD